MRIAVRMRSPDAIVHETREPRARTQPAQCSLPKMADGLLCTEDANAENVIDKTLVKTCESDDKCATADTRHGAGANNVHFPYSNVGIIQELCLSGPNSSSSSATSTIPFKLDIAGAVGVVAVDREITTMQPCSPNTEEDCRKKRCVDRYDSSESSDSGVAILSCTDCSGSSTASSDITDPGSPYSIASNHSDQDSNNSNNSNPTTLPTSNSNHQPPPANKPAPPLQQQMAPTQIQSSAHHPPWHWAEDSSPPLKRPPNNNQIIVTSTPLSKMNVCVNNNKIPPSESLLKTIVASSKSKMQQGKITEYFKSHHKPKEFLTLIDNLKRGKKLLNRSVPPPGKVAIEKLTKPRKTPAVTTPRKILPAPSKSVVNQTDNTHLTVNNLTNITNLNVATQFPTQTMTLTTLTFPTATYIHQTNHKPTQGHPRPQEQEQVQFIPHHFANQFVHHSNHPPISNYIKINVPIVKLNTIATASPAPAMTALETASPTVLTVPIRKAGCAPVACLEVGNASLGVKNAALPLSGSSLPPNAFTIGSSNKRKPSNNSNSLITEPISSTPPLASSKLVLTSSSTLSIATASVTQSSSSDTSCKSTSTASSSSTSNVKDFNNSSRTPTTIINASPFVILSSQSILSNKTPPESALLNSATAPSKQLGEVANKPERGDFKLSARSSPVDSEDSGFSLSTLSSLSLPAEASPSATPCQKSPILSVPKTIRFPAAAGTVLGHSSATIVAQQQILGKGTHHLLKKRKSPVNGDPVSTNGGLCSAEKRSNLLAEGIVACMWSECHAQFEASGALLEHLQIKHVISQATCEHYVCLWQGCKVHGRTSCSRSWLERHVLAHAGTKPFRCIVDGCGMRFNSQLTLQRHVNGHFNGDQNQNGTSKKSVENALKLYKRNGKKIRFRRQPWSARMFDFIDASIMEGLQYRLVQMTEKRTLGQFESNVGNTAVLQTQVLGRRVNTDGAKQLLVRYHPKDILPDEWIKETDYSLTKTVIISKLNAPAKSSLQESLFTTETTLRQSKKHRRKPLVLKPT